jgi:hypothetical protein
MNGTVTITTKSIAKGLNKIKISNFNSSQFYSYDLEKLTNSPQKRANSFESAIFQTIVTSNKSLNQPDDEVIEKIGWEDENALAQLFQEIEDEEVELANYGVNTYADSLTQFDKYAR